MWQRFNLFMRKKGIIVPQKKSTSFALMRCASPNPLNTYNNTRDNNVVHHIFILA